MVETGKKMNDESPGTVINFIHHENIPHLIPPKVTSIVYRVAKKDRYHRYFQNYGVKEKSFLTKREKTLVILCLYMLQLECTFRLMYSLSA